MAKTLLSVLSVGLLVLFMASQQSYSATGQTSVTAKCTIVAANTEEIYAQVSGKGISLVTVILQKNHGQFLYAQDYSFKQGSFITIQDTITTSVTADTFTVKVYQERGQLAAITTVPCTN